MSSKINNLRYRFLESWRQRQDTTPALVTMYRVPPDGAWWPAVGAPLERVVRRHRADARLRLYNSIRLGRGRCLRLVRTAVSRSSLQGTLFLHL